MLGETSQIVATNNSKTQRSPRPTRYWIATADYIQKLGDWGLLLIRLHRFHLGIAALNLV